MGSEQPREGVQLLGAQHEARDSSIDEEVRPPRRPPRRSCALRRAYEAGETPVASPQRPQLPRAGGGGDVSVRQRRALAVAASWRAAPGLIPPLFANAQWEALSKSGCPDFMLFSRAVNTFVQSLPAIMEIGRAHV